MDPSLALAFFCRTEDDYSQLAEQLRVVSLFEVLQCFTATLRLFFEIGCFFTKIRLSLQKGAGSVFGGIIPCKNCSGFYRGGFLRIAFLYLGIDWQEWFKRTEIWKYGVHILSGILWSIRFFAFVFWWCTVNFSVCYLLQRHLSSNYLRQGRRISHHFYHMLEKTQNCKVSTADGLFLRAGLKERKCEFGTDLYFRSKILFLSDYTDLGEMNDSYDEFELLE